MKNYVQPGNAVEFTAPSGGVVSGNGYLIGGLFVVALGNAAEGAKFQGQVTGVIALPKAGSQAWTEGARVYWDDTEHHCTTDDSKGPIIGVATDSVSDAAGATTGNVRLNGCVFGDELAGVEAGATGLALLADATAAEARSTLELGTAATKDVGTAAGTVAAGDDARLSDARTPTDGSVTAAKIANAAAGVGVPIAIVKTIAAGVAGEADDVEVVDALPFKARLLDVSMIVTAGNDAGRTAQLRTAAAGAGDALSEAFDCATSGRKRTAAAAATPILAAESAVYLRRSHDAVAGEVQLTLVREA